MGGLWHCFTQIKPIQPTRWVALHWSWSTAPHSWPPWPTHWPSDDRRWAGWAEAKTGKASDILPWVMRIFTTYHVIHYVDIRIYNYIYLCIYVSLSLYIYICVYIYIYIYIHIFFHVAKSGYVIAATWSDRTCKLWGIPTKWDGYRTAENDQGTRHKRNPAS